MVSIPARRVLLAAAAALLAGCGGHSQSVWQLPNHDLTGTRAASGSRIDAGNVARLRVSWRFRFTAKPSFSGLVTSTPVTDGRTVYVQDLAVATVQVSAFVI